MALFRKNARPRQRRVLPVHIGIIMDGNGRWAQKRGLPRKAGHSAGAKNFQSIARYCNKIGIRYLTVYAFSTENWKRPQEEVDNLMNILRDYLKDAIANFHDENIKTRFIGELSKFPEDIRDLIRQAEEGSRNDTGLVLNIAINYGGRDEILHSVRRLAERVQKGGLIPAEIDEAAIEEGLYTAGQPDPDLIIRPSGEYRLSNFMMWQAAYSEFWYSNILWPDFSTDQLEKALDDYAARSRRFGGV